jgi:GNAT superfamily N-acetyltransferase
MEETPQDAQALVRTGATKTPEITKVRLATLEDGSGMAVLLGELGYPTDSVSFCKRLEGMLARDDYRVLVAERDGELCGLVSACWGLYLEHDGRWGRITALVVAEAYRGQGVGMLLVAHAESWLQSQQAIACIVNSSLVRAEAHRFYEHRGYRVTGFRFVKPFGSVTKAG